MKTTWQGLPKQPRAVFRKMKIEQEKGEIIGTLPGARFICYPFTRRSLSARQGLAGGGVGGLIATKKPLTTNNAPQRFFNTIQNTVYGTATYRGQL